MSTSNADNNAPEPEIAGEGGSSRPSSGDWALMRYLDGELEPELARAVEARLDSDEAARDKAAGLALVASLLREQVNADSRADGIADAVMARLDEADALETGSAGGDAAPSNERVAADDKPANDNARVIFTLATVAAAAAAALFVWGTIEPDDTVATAPPAEAPVELPPLPPRPERAPATAEVEAEETPQPVEVAAVDFGSQSGSVFYVSGQNAATAVVWVTGGEEP